MSVDFYVKLGEQFCSDTFKISNRLIFKKLSHYNCYIIVNEPVSQHYLKKKCVIYSNVLRGKVVDHCQIPVSFALQQVVSVVA